MTCPMWSTTTNITTPRTRRELRSLQVMKTTELPGRCRRLQRFIYLETFQSDESRGMLYEVSAGTRTGPCLVPGF